MITKLENTIGFIILETNVPSLIKANKCMLKADYINSILNLLILKEFISN